MNFYQNSLALSCRNPFSFLLYQRLARNPLFEAISLLVPMGPLNNKSFLATRCLSILNLFKEPMPA
jgi:hypothetical protein